MRFCGVYSNGMNEITIELNDLTIELLGKCAEITNNETVKSLVEFAVLDFLIRLEVAKLRKPEDLAQILFKEASKS